MPADGSDNDASATNLITNDEGLSNWNGPYLSYSSTNGITIPLNKAGLQYGYFIRAGIEPWNATTGVATDAKCDGTINCYIWISFRLADGNSNSPILKKFDDYIDNGDGRNVGKFRYINIDTGVLHNYAVLLVGPSIRKTQN